MTSGESHQRAKPSGEMLLNLMIETTRANGALQGTELDGEVAPMVFPTVGHQSQASARGAGDGSAREFKA